MCAHVYFMKMCVRVHLSRGMNRITTIIYVH